VRLLLDTHTFLWWIADDPALSQRARQEIGETGNSVYVSAASAYEIAVKTRLGKLPGAAAIAGQFARRLMIEGFSGLAIEPAHADRAGLLPGPHRDPFDRLLIAQAQQENLTLVSLDAVFDGYGVERLW
jgi:PIN domain nuclease of toxin-antitoxin system